MELFGRRKHRVNDQENLKLTINIALISTLSNEISYFLKRADIHLDQAMKALPAKN
jgi:hypothetical protein